MKKSLLWILTIVMILAVSIALVGCGASDETTANDSGSSSDVPAEKTYKAACIFPVSDPYNGGGFERMMLEGCEALRTQLGWQVDIAEGVDYSKVYEVAAGYASEGYDIIFFPDGGMYDSWYNLPAEYPDTWFAMMSLVNDIPKEGKACAIKPDKFGYGVIVGATMAMMSETGKIGIVGGLPVGSILMEFSGIIEGAKAAVPGTEVLVGWTGDYEDIAKHSETTRLLIEDGADVLFTVTGPGYKGVWEAAESANARVIGYAYDSYNIDPEVISGSVAYDGVGQYLLIGEALEAGTLTNDFYPVGYDYVKICDFRGSIDSTLETKILEYCNKVINGEIVIPEVSHDF